MKLKKLLSVLFIVTLIFSITACGEDDESEATGEKDIYIIEEESEDSSSEEMSQNEEQTQTESEQQPVQNEFVEREINGYETWDEYLKWADDWVYNSLATGKSGYENAREKGWSYFAGTDWNSIFTFSSEVHYVLDYNFRTAREEESDYGTYVAYCSAEIQNAFGGVFNSHVYMYLDMWGEPSRLFYDEVDGSFTEIPL